MQSKQVALITSRGTTDLELQSGTTPSDMLQTLGLDSEHMVCPSNGLPFGPHEDVFPMISDGQRLYVVTPASVAATTL